MSIKHKLQLQESEYRLPVHWLLRKAGHTIYVHKTNVMATMIKKYPTTQARVNYALDVGCGDGRGTFELSECLGGYTFTGIDFSPRAIAFAKLMAPNLDFSVQSGSSIDAGDQSIDLVVAREVIEHIPPTEIPAFLSEIHRVLTPGGKVLITTPSTNRRVPDKHFQHFTEALLRSLLEKTDFQVLECIGLGYWPHQRIENLYRRLIALPTLWRIHEYLGTRILKPMYADNLIIIAERKS